MLVEMWFVEVRIRMPGIVKFEKQTDGTRRRTLRSDPDVESGFKRADNAEKTIPYFRRRTQQPHGEALSKLELIGFITPIRSGLICCFRGNRTTSRQFDQLN